VLKQLEEEGREATAAEQHFLVKYVGWGGLINAFPDQNGRVKAGWEDVAAELKELLTPEEYESARASTPFAHYTSETVIRAMWCVG